MENLKIEEQATNYETFRHIEKVRNNLNKFISALLKRGEKHDQSKLESPEVELFTKYTKILSNLTYGSVEYNENKKAMGPALEHHYANNRHHPEHWPAYDSKEADVIEEYVDALLDDGHDVNSILITSLRSYIDSLRSPINNMNLVDHCEMLSDWKASSERHNDGNIRKSIEINAKRFGLSKQMQKVYENTVDLFNDDNQ